MLELRLERIEDLFAVPDGSMFGEYPRLYPGIDELVETLDARPVRDPHVVIHLPEAELRSDTQPRIERALHAYCDQRLEHTWRDIRSQMRSGLRALAFGIVVFTLGFQIAQDVARSSIDADVRAFLADGIFLVFAWVGLWYPLDALIHYPARQRRDRRVLRRLRAAEVAVLPW